MDETRAFPRLLGFRHTGAGRNTASTTTLANRDLGALLRDWDGSSFVLERNTIGELEDHRYYWGLLEDRTPTALRPFHGFYVREVNSQRLTAGTTTFTGSPIPSVQNPGRTMLWPLAVRAGSAAQDWASASVTAYLDGSSRVRIDRGGSTGPVTPSWAIVELGASWGVTRLDATLSTRGTDVELSGAGSTPWSRKLYVVTQRVPVNADDLADHVLVRTSKDDPDKLILSLPAAGTAGTFTLSVYVLEHPLLNVTHWDTVDSSGYGAIGVNTVEELELIPEPPFEPDEVSIICHSDGQGNNTNYPRAHWGYTIEDESLFLRRGRTAPRGQNYSAQLVRWPVVPRGHPGPHIGHTTFSY